MTITQGANRLVDPYDGDAIAARRTTRPPLRDGRPAAGRAHGYLHPNDKAAIVAAAAVLRERFPVEAIYLFGSKATGRDDPESDIDLLVLTSRSLHWRERDTITDILFDVEMRFEVVISTLIVNLEEWQHGAYQVLAIRDEIERDGVAA